MKPDQISGRLGESDIKGYFKIGKEETQEGGEKYSELRSLKFPCKHTTNRNGVLREPCSCGPLKGSISKRRRG